MDHHPSDSLFATMRTVIEAPGYPLLKSYRQDFYQHDRATLRKTYTPEMSYLWIVRKMGTHLYPLHLSEHISHEANAALSLQDSAREIYLIAPGIFKQIGLQKALDEIKQMDYQVIDGFVCKYHGGSRKIIAAVATDLCYNKGRRYGLVRYSGEVGFDNLRERDLVALRCIAVGLVHQSGNCLFTPCVQITYDDQSLMPQATECWETLPA